MKTICSVLILLVASFTAVRAQNGGPPPPPEFLTVPDNFVLENVPPIPTAIVRDTARYGDSRSAMLYSWHPTARSILVGTRFADTAQVHSVSMPGGARSQLTFYPDRVAGAKYLPDGNGFLFLKDEGGGEWFQIYRYDVASGAVTMMTDGKSRNGAPLIAHHQPLFAYNSTRRDGHDTDIWIEDASNPASAKMLLQVEGGGWDVTAWSPDNKQVLVTQAISVNESYLWLVDVATGDKKLITPKQPANEPTIAYNDAAFSHDGKSLYVLSDSGDEFVRLARYDLATMKLTFLTSSIPWDVEAMSLSEDGHSLAFSTNEDGISRLYLLDTATDHYKPIPNIPTGIIVSLLFHPNGHDLAFDFTSSRTPIDVFSVDIRTNKVERWTRSETGGLNTATFVEPKLIHWKTFDGKQISGFLYQPDPAKFPGKRPVMLNIHGGPEGQFRPYFNSQQDYLINVLGVAIIAPNVRGSTGYGKTFLKLDNGFHRDDTYKDINALLDWIGTAPDLDPSRVMAYGGSYGGHMTWAVAAFYNDRIRCAMPIVGMSNLVTFLEHTESYRRDLRRVEYGDERDPAMRAYLEKIAPMNHLDSMHKPIFAVVGKNDPRVPWTESRQILDKLNAQGTPTWFMMANDEGHGYAKKKNRDLLFDAQVLFMQKYLLDGMPAAETK